MSVPTEVVKLVEQFRTEAEAVRSSQYKEAWVRRDYLDPLFTALGWDVAYEHRDTRMYREVILEDTLKVEGATKAPDYCFYVRKRQEVLRRGQEAFREPPGREGNGVSGEEVRLVRQAAPFRSDGF